MKYFLSMVSVVALLTACASQQASAPTTPVATDPLADPRSEMVVDCTAYYGAYAPYIQPSYPEQAKQYYSVAHQNSTTALALIAMEGNQPFSMARMLPAGSVYNAREAQWGRFLQTATPEAAMQQTLKCNEFAPTMGQLTAAMRQTPTLAPMYQAMDQMLSQRLSGQRR